VRLLHRLGDHRDLGHLEKAAVVTEALLRPRALEDLHRLVEAVTALLLRHAEAAELGGPVAASHPHVEASVGDDVHQRHLLGQSERVVKGQDGGGQADADAPGARGGGGGEAGGIYREAVVDEVMLGEPRLVEAQLLRPLDLLELAADDVLVPVARRSLEKVEGAEAHAEPPQVIPR